MRLEYQRWSGDRGYTAAQFNQTVSDAAGVDVSALLQMLIATTEEIDYTEMLDWFGLRFMTPEAAVETASAAPPAQGAPVRRWTLEVRPDATPAQPDASASMPAAREASTTRARASASSGSSCEGMSPASRLKSPAPKATRFTRQGARYGRRLRACRTSRAARSST